jgi:hypothetical protein
MKHRLSHVKRRDGIYCRMVGVLFVQVTVEKGKVAVLAPKAVSPGWKPVARQ